MTDDEFWRLIATLRGRVGDDDLERLGRRLRQLPAAEITAFADRLAVVLHQLDRHDLWVQPVSDVESPDEVFPLSDDAFLYARCAVVAAGEQTYQRVLADPTAFAGAWDLGAELLMYAADEAYEDVTGEEWDHETPVSAETGSNSAGWPDRAEAASADETAEETVGVTGCLAPKYAGPNDDWGVLYGLPKGTDTVGFPIEMSLGLFDTERQLSDLIASTGGLPPGLRRVAVDLELDDHWDLVATTTEHEPGWLSARIGVAAVDAMRWSPEEQQLAAPALAAHVLLAVIAPRAPEHPALGELRAMRAAGAHVVPVDG